MRISDWSSDVCSSDLGGVVDEDVEAARRGDVFGETDHLGGIAQIDADDLESVQPLRRVGETAEAANGVTRESRRDRRVRAVAEEPQRDVHADLRSSAGEQRSEEHTSELQSLMRIS